MGKRGGLQGLVLIVALVSGARPAAAQDLNRVHALYNEGRYAEAIDAATQAQAVPATRQAAGVALARAHLERYRDAGDPTDVLAARAALSAVQAAALTVRGRIDYSFGLGQALFFENDIGAAAELFASVTPQAWAVDPALGEAMADRLHQDLRLAKAEPSRAAMAAMVEAGAVSAWLSGSGPTVACFVRSGEADRVMAALPTNGRARVVPIDHQGARLVDV